MSSSTTDTIACLQAAIDSLTNNNDAPPSSPQQVQKFWAGFTLKKVMYREEPNGSIKSKSFSKLIKTLIDNSTMPYNENEFSVGWQFRYDNSSRPNPDSPKRTYPGDSITPDNITQLVVKVNTSGSLVGVREIPVWAKISDYPIGSTDTTVKIVCKHHKIYRNFRTEYHNFLERSSEKLKLRDFEFYKRETQLVFFTTTQLLLIGTILKNSISTTTSGKAKVLFSGYDQYVGRTGMSSRMDRMTDFANRGVPDPTNWFSLKAEIIPAREFLDKAGPMAEESENDGPPNPGNCCCEPKEQAPPSPCERLAASLNKNEDEAEIPSVANGHPCPDPWYYTTAILGETNAKMPTNTPARDACLLRNLLT